MLHGFEKFIAMGGFGDYIWSAYGISAVVLIGLIIFTVIEYKKVVPKKSINKIN